MVLILAEDASTLKFLKMMVEAVKDVTITEEIRAVNAEALAVLVEDVMAKEVRVQEAEVSDQEAIVRVLVVKADVKADSKVLLQKENQVHFNEKKERHVVQKEALTDQQVVRLTLQKTEDQEEVKFL